MGRVLAVDPGEVRVGLALSDPSRIIASPFDVLPRRPEKALLARIAAIVAAQEVERVVVGLPVRLDGTSGPEAADAERLARKIEAAARVPVELYDERMTTVSAEAALIEGDVSRGKRKLVRDKVAAAILLEAWLGRRISS